ncbi:MAG: hypothetical protein R2784_03550 [Saprospiraceae bacterium]
MNTFENLRQGNHYRVDEEIVGLEIKTTKAAGFIIVWIKTLEDLKEINGKKEHSISCKRQKWEVVFFITFYPCLPEQDQGANFKCKMQGIGKAFQDAAKEGKRKTQKPNSKTF